ncbi:isopeptide-forming domain-containing fimbrial protein [Microbulbifer pacificus]|uniref:Isopeptide-forming domain-containing fimbrial protein n=1 Tax=Microbulbifer pacificus TaxID=407164 RepID=A0AAU0MW26_9GAMM|nr:isopeptide-forming domain-containing fimbrial protein [Microbulbifer pacificus]WOX04765.1 isopeptide-forming domain-containing fimbrial protein [Microbulbifer pacificus]
MLLLASGQVWAAYSNMCVVGEQNPPTNLVDVMGSSYCELCGFGYVDVQITNPYRAGENADGDQPYDTRVVTISGDTRTQTRRNSSYGSQNPALNFNNSNGLTITLNNGLELYTGQAPVLPLGGSLSGTSAVTLSNMSDLSPGQTVTLRIPVHRPPNNSPESLYNTTPQATATISYTMADSCNDAPGQRENFRSDNTWYDGCGGNRCSGSEDPDNYPTDFWQSYTRPDGTDSGAVDIRQPAISLNKQGWNYDSGQREGTRSDQVFGHNDDDIVWRINIQNTGDAPLQDLRIDDVLSRADVMDANYVCANVTDANNAAANNGTPTGGSSCIATDAATGTVLNDWDLDAPFGHNDNIPAPYAATVNAVTAGTSTDAIDIRQGGNINLYVVGKIHSNGSCASGRLTNTFNDVEFGCAVQTPPGGIDSGEDDTALLDTFYGLNGGTNALRVERQLTGITGTGPVGMRGLMTITLRNEGHGTVWFDPAMAWHLRDELPDEYVVDPSYAPRIETQNSLYGPYLGRVDTLQWVNAQGAIPGNTGDSTSYLNNSEPQFKLTSSTTDTDADQAEESTGLMRHGDVVVIRFAVVMKAAEYFDRAADLDVLQEDPAVALFKRPGERTDPDLSGFSSFDNIVEMQIKTLCNTQGLLQSRMTGNGQNDTFAANSAGTPVQFDPEELDVSIDQPTFIITDDRSQTTPLSVTLSNHGGDEARDFRVFISFGATINVVSNTSPMGFSCAVVPITQSSVDGNDRPMGHPDPYRVWAVNPAPDQVDKMHMLLPTNGTVYQCQPDGSPFTASFAAGASATFEFEVNKTTSSAGVAADDLTFRADVVGEIFTLSDFAITPAQINYNTVNANQVNNGGNRSISNITVNNPTGITNGHPLWFPAPGLDSAGNKRTDGEVDRGNLYSLDAHWSRGIGFNLKKDQVTAGDTGSGNFGGVPDLGVCNENTAAVTRAPANTFPGQTKPAEHVQVGEECTVRIQTGGWFGFDSRGFNFIGVRDIQVLDLIPNGQGYISSTVPLFTPQIAGATQAPNDPSTTALGELSPFGWRFTGTEASGFAGAPNSDYVIDIDQWFTINNTSRLLNKIQNDRAAPNVHGSDSANVLDSSFKGVFFNNNTGIWEEYEFGSYGGGETVGYPKEPIRRVDVVIAEPLINVVKEICAAADFNAASGACGAGWNADYQGASTTNDYIYRLTVNSEAAADGHPRPPVYDLTVEDTLPDLLFIEDLNADGIDNDGDGLVDAADTDGEGSIVGNVMNDGNPTTITFSHTQGVDGTGLRRLEPGASAYMYYRVDPDDRIAPSEVLTNTVVVTYYDSLEGSANEHGNQTVVMPGSGELGGARTYPAAADTNTEAEASLTFSEPATEPKTITGLSETPLVGSGIQPVKIGEEIEYTLTAELPVAQLRNLTVTDQLPAGLVCTEAPAIDLSTDAPWSAAGFKRPDLSNVGDVTPVCSDSQVQWSFGDVVLTNPSSDRDPNRFTFELKFVARVQNSAANNDSTSLINGQPATNATLEWRDESGSDHSLDYGQVEAQITEPLIALTKSWDATADLDAGDVITITLTATNNGTANAYNLRLWDDLLDSEMTFVDTSVTGTTVPDSVDTTTFGANRPVFVWNPENPLVPGASREFSFQVRIDDTAQPLQQLSNIAHAAWTSLPGQSTALNTVGEIGIDGALDGQRVGELPHASDAINDYEASSNTVDTVLAALAFTKEDITANGTAAETRTIGAHREFQLEVAVPDGVSNNVRITDSLAAGGTTYVLARDANYEISCSYVGIELINGVAPVDGACNFNGVPTSDATGDVVWDIGTVDTVSEDDAGTAPVSPTITIHYFARIDNEIVETQAGDSLRNDATLNYSNGQTGAEETLADSTAAITAVEPDLEIVKAVTNTTGSAGLAQGGDVLEYVLTIRHTGASTVDAFDLNVLDILPPEVRFEASFAPTASINGSPVAGFVAAPATPASDQLVWGRENGDNGLDLPLGQTLEITYRANVVSVFGQPVMNEAYVDWSSLDDNVIGQDIYQRHGFGCPTVTDPNNYCYGPAQASINTEDNSGLQKLVVSDSYDDPADSTVRVGDTVTYRLEVNVQPGTTNAVVVTDTMDTGLVLESFTVDDASGGYVFTPVSQPSAGDTSLTWNFGNVTRELGTAAPLIIEYVARVTEDAGIPHVASTTLSNTAILSYTDGSGNPPTDPDVLASLESTVTVTVLQPVIDNLTKIDRDGRSSPYLVGDIANDVMRFSLQACNSGAAPAYDMQLTDDLPWEMDEASIQNIEVAIDGTAVAESDYTYTPPAGRDGNMVFALGVPVDPGLCVTVNYDIGFHTDVGGDQSWQNTFVIDEYWSLPDTSGQKYAPVQLPAPFVMSTAAAVVEPLVKALLLPADGTATVGEQVQYRITVPGVANTAVALRNVQVIDTLDSLGDIVLFESATLNGEAFTPVVDQAAGTITFDIPSIDVGTVAEIEIFAQVADVATAIAGTVITNTADFTYEEGGNNLPGGGNDVSFTIVEPDLIMDKSGPTNVQAGLPGRFVLDVHNAGEGTAYGITLTDILPSAGDGGEQGGMCTTPPENITAEILDGAGNSVSTLSAGTDFTTSYDVNTCTLIVTTTGDGGAVAADHHLQLAYDAYLDMDTEHGAVLTNIAGATQWFGLPADADLRRGYDRTITDGSPSVVDFEDAFTITAQVPRVAFAKTVENITRSENPAVNASPADLLRYTLTLTNEEDVAVDDFKVQDDLGSLNAFVAFASGTLNIVSLPTGADSSASDATGGTNGAGLLDVSNLSLAPAGQAGDRIEIVFEVQLAAVIDNASVVLNQAQLQLPGQSVFVSDDPNINGVEDPEVAGDEDPTRVIIESAPLLKVEKISEDLTGEPDSLMPGDTLRYTIRVENIGNENMLEASLRDQVPANTTYVAGSTTLNGASLDDVNGTTPLTQTLVIQSPGSETGELLADPAASGAQAAIITFDVTINNVKDGTLISNQGFANGVGAGSGNVPVEEKPSDDPTTEVADDPTIDIVGNVPLLRAQKTVQLAVDNLTTGIVDPEDVLRYTITVTNLGGKDATEARFVDLVPEHTTYVAGSTTLNGIAITDNGVDSPLVAGIAISSEDLTPPLPAEGEGVLTTAQTATIVFDVMVNADTERGTIISNQGNVYSLELPLTLTDADGNSSNGAQPTEVVVGDAQQLSITKEVAVVGGGAAESGKVLEYIVRVTNISAVPASLVSIYDDLLVAGEGVLTYVADSARLNGLADGVMVDGSLITADYSNVYGDLQPSETITLRFEAKLGENLAMGYTVVNTAQVKWNDPPAYNEATVTIDIGGTPGIANLSGYLWHDVNFSETTDSEEQLLTNWSVELYYNNALLETVQSDDKGYFQFAGLVPNLDGANVAVASYELRYLAPNAVGTTASLGTASSDYTNGPQQIRDIYIDSGSNPQNLNLPITPNGVIYDSVLRAPVNGARVRLLGASSGQPLPDSCFDDPKQQNQVTLTGGFYKFDVNFSSAACAVNADYLIELDVPSADYVAGPSQIIPPQTGVDTGSFDVAACLGSAADMIPGTPYHCEVQLSVLPPSIDLDARSSETDYYLRVNLDDSNQPGSSQLFNNHIALDPQLEGALALTKTAAMLNVTRSQLVPYTITFSNSLPVPLTDLQLVDYFPAGFKYVAGSANLDGVKVEPEVNGLQLQWPSLRAEPEQTHSMKLLLVVGSGVGEGEYINRARMFNELSGQQTSGEASATVRVVPDPTFDCTDVIGKVFDDKNLNGYQDAGEGGVPGARVVTANGLKATADAHGRFHITCAAVPNPDRGSNFVLKLDDRSLPSGYRLTTENPRVQRATRGKMLEFNFGTSLHRVVRLDLAEAVFEPGTSELRPQWRSRTELLLERLQEAPSVLRLSYLAENEDPSLVDARLATIKARIAEDWAALNCCYPLNIETEIFWRRGAPPARGNVLDGLKHSVNRMIGSDDQGGAR